MQSDPTLLGTVQSVQGATVSVALDRDTASGLAFVEGHGYRIGQIGSFVRIPVGYTDLFGVVSQVGAAAIPEHAADADPHGYRWMTVELVGEAARSGEFRRGVAEYPTIGDSVHLVVEHDLARIYGTVAAGNLISIGSLASADSIPALIDTDKLIARHSAILGTTGAGKSTTVSALVRSLSEPDRFPAARIVVFDLHGEYASALKDRATIFRINPNADEQPLFVPYWALTFDEFQSLTLGDLDDVSRAAVMEKVTALKSSSLAAEPRSGVVDDNLTVDTPVPFSINKLWFDFHRLVFATHTTEGTGQSEATEALLMDDDGRRRPVQPGDPMKVIPPKYVPQKRGSIILSAAGLNMRRQLMTLAARLRDPRLSFLFRPGPWFPNLDGIPSKDLDALLAGWIGGPHPVTVLDLSGIPNSILTDLIGVLLRTIYDALFWARNLPEGGRARPVLFVLEEAHAYLGQGDAGPAASAVRRIVKEGRKYGMSAMIVSQRPAEVDSTILSQCGTLVAMRLSNASDRSHVTSVVPDNLSGLLSMLPALRTGEAIVVGEAVRLPMRTLIDAPPPNLRPNSADPLIFDPVGPTGWNQPKQETTYEAVLTAWRQQDPIKTTPQIPDPPAEVQ